MLVLLLSSLYSFLKVSSSPSIFDIFSLSELLRLLSSCNKKTDYLNLFLAILKLPVEFFLFLLVFLQLLLLVILENLQLLLQLHNQTPYPDMLADFSLQFLQTGLIIFTIIASNDATPIYSFLAAFLIIDQVFDNVLQEIGLICYLGHIFWDLDIDAVVLEQLAGFVEDGSNE